MIDQPSPNEKVLINEAEGHVLPPVLNQAELPVVGIVIGPVGGTDDLFAVKVPSMHDARLQLHRSQLFRRSMEPGPWRDDPIRRGLAAALGEDVADRLQEIADEAVANADRDLTFDSPGNRNDALGFLGLCLAGHMREQGGS